VRFRSSLVLLCLMGYAAGIAAQSYPNKPVRVLVPTAAGSIPDVVARLITPGLSALLGQPFLVDNRSGANGMLGTELAAKATPDGHTLLIGTPATLTIVHYVHKQVPYETLKDYAPIGLIALGPYLFVAHPSVPAKSVAELVTLAKAEPGKLSYGSQGNGSAGHLAMELFKTMAGIDIRHVPAKSAPQAAEDLLGGHVNLSMLPISPVLPQVKAKRLRALAVTTDHRVRQLPQTPTVGESGLQGYQAGTWFGMLAPAKTPAAIVAQLSEALQKVLRAAETRAQFQRQGAEVASGEPGELGALLRRELTLYGKVSRTAHIKSD